MEDGKTKTEEERIQEIEEVEANVKCMKDFTSPEQLYEELIRSIRKYHPSTDISMIEKAYRIAAKAHEGQKRKSGEPYIIHPLCVAIILADLELDKETIVAGLLHDVVEDTVMTTEDLTREFGSEVALLVDGVTKLGQLNYSADKVEVQAEKLKKDVPCHGKGHPCDSGKTGGPAAQHAYRTVLVGAETEGKSQRDDGYLCADRTASRYFQDQDRAG